MKRLVSLIAFTLLTLHLTSLAFTDSSSINFTLLEDRFTAGGGSASSVNYQIAETSFDTFSGLALSSANYALDTKIGISGGADIGTINSITPGDFARFYLDTNASYAIQASVQGGNTLQYGAKQDTITKVNAQIPNTVSWVLNSLDIGRHTNTLQVIAPEGTTIKKQDAYVLRRPVK